MIGSAHGHEALAAPASAREILPWGWDLHRSVIVGAALFAAAYLYAIGPMRRRVEWAGEIGRRQVILFLMGVLAILMALISPLDRLADDYLFSAHMAQHVLFIWFMAPLLILGTPGWLLRPLIVTPAIARMARFLTRPAVAYLLFNAVFLIWHLPSPYELALQNEAVHILQHLTFMVTSVIAWWPALGPLPELVSPSYPFRMIYLFLQCLPNTLLSALFVFSPRVIYPFYAHAPRPFGISAHADQQLGGLLMWIPGSIVYLAAISVLFFRWQQSEAQEGADNLQL